MNYVILVPKKFDSLSKKCHFRWNFRRKNFFGTILLHQKIHLLNLSLCSYFWAIILISFIIRILDDFGSLLPAGTVTVKVASTTLLKPLVLPIRRCYHSRPTHPVDCSISVSNLSFMRRSTSSKRPKLSAEFCRTSVLNVCIFHLFEIKVILFFAFEIDHFRIVCCEIIVQNQNIQVVIVKQFCCGCCFCCCRGCCCCGCFCGCCWKCCSANTGTQWMLARSITAIRTIRVAWTSITASKKIAIACWRAWWIRFTCIQT